MTQRLKEFPEVWWGKYKTVKVNCLLSPINNAFNYFYFVIVRDRGATHAFPWLTTEVAWRRNCYRSNSGSGYGRLNKTLKFCFMQSYLIQLRYPLSWSTTLGGDLFWRLFSFFKLIAKPLMPMFCFSSLVYLRDCRQRLR